MGVGEDIGNLYTFLSIFLKTCNYSLKSLKKKSKGCSMLCACGNSR